jgi:CheY-like chemotaxis protein
VRKSADALMTIINDILDFSKIESGKLDLEIGDVDVRTLAADILDLLATRAGEKEIDLGAVIDPSVPTKIRGDAGRLRQVLTNLVGNAVKFTDCGFAVIRMSRIEEDTQSFLRVEVEDTGIGISEETCARLFEPFRQGDSSYSRRYGGTGLGLVISRRLVELMGGKMGVESKPGVGSTFGFTLPIKPGPNGEIWFPPGRARHRVVGFSSDALGREILQAATQTYFDRSSIVVADASDLVQALEQPTNAVIIDARIETNTRELIDRVRARMNSDAFPIVLLTTIGGAPIASASNDHTVAINKPVRYSKLANGIDLSIHPRRRKSEVGLERTSASGVPIKASILLVEDNAVNRLVAIKHLEKLGIRVASAQNGKIGAEMATASTYDLILMDCQMPEMDGFEATRVIRANEPATRHVPVIALTANAMRGDRERCLESGMDDYLAKPLRPNELEQVIRKWIDVSTIAN